MVILIIKPRNYLKIINFNVELNIMAKKYNIWVKETAQGFYNVLLYIITVAVLIYLFPHEGKFRYEFQKGRPWMHESLIAPFDFPIYKMDDELTAEKDSILRSYKPYFNLDSKIEDDQVFHLHEYLNKRFQLFLSQNESQKARILQVKDKIIDTLIYNIQFVYQQGIIIIPENVNAITLIKVQNNVAEETELTDVFTPKSAYRYLLRNATVLMNNQGNTKENIFVPFFKGLNLDRFIVPNMFYDVNSSDNARSELISKISLSRGMVQRGERIILTGDIVNAETYRILLSLKKETEARIEQTGNLYIIIAGQALLVGLIILILFFYVEHYKKQATSQKVKTYFISLVILIMCSVTSFF